MKAALNWLEGADAIRSRVDPWWSACEDPLNPSQAIAQSRHRSLFRLGDDPELSLLIKRFNAGEGLHRMVSSTKSRFQRAPWQREWRALNALWSAGVAVPKPLGLAQTLQGHGLLVTGFVDGTSLWDALQRQETVSYSILESCAQAIGRLHAAGWAHGDCHPGNILLSSGGPVLIDFQRAAQINPRNRIEDIARLHFSRAFSAFTQSQQEQLIQQALGSGPTSDPSAKQVLARSKKLAGAHRRTRLRQSLKPSEDRIRLRTQGGMGLRRPDFDEHILEAVLENQGPLSGENSANGLSPNRYRAYRFERGGQVYGVCEDRPLTLFSRLFSSFFGSPARRAWQRAHDPLAPPDNHRLLAFSEWRSNGLFSRGIWITQEPEPKPSEEDSPKLSGD